eukprot:2301037-Alexandrium_andersonii.AAC.1
MAGDFNFVEHDDDRFTVQGQEGARDTAAERQAFLQLRQRSGLYPLDLELHTFRSCHGTSKLDRAYTNLHVAEQQYR